MTQTVSEFSAAYRELVGEPMRKALEKPTPEWRAAMAQLSESLTALGEAARATGAALAVNIAGASMQMQRYGKSLRAAQELLRQWQAGDLRPTYVYGDALHLIAKEDLAALGGTVDEYADYSLVTFNEADRDAGRAKASTGEDRFFPIGFFSLPCPGDREVAMRGSHFAGEAEFLDVDLEELRLLAPERPAPKQPDYLRHDPTKDHRRERKARRGGARYARKGFWG